MTILQELQVKQSTIRQSINSLLGNDARTEEQQGELETLTAEGQAIEPEIRAAIVAEPDPETAITQTGDPEQRERLEIRKKTGLGDFLAAAVAGREVSGAAKEYADAVGCAPLNRLPLDIFRNGQPETRAITSGPAIDGPVEPAVPFVFQRSAAESLGIQMPTHGPGRYRCHGSLPHLRLTRWRRMPQHRQRRQSSLWTRKRPKESAVNLKSAPKIWRSTLHLRQCLGSLFVRRCRTS